MVFMRGNKDFYLGLIIQVVVFAVTWTFLKGELFHSDDVLISSGLSALLAIILTGTLAFLTNKLKLVYRISGIVIYFILFIGVIFYISKPHNFEKNISVFNGDWVTHTGNDTMILKFESMTYARILIPKSNKNVKCVFNISNDTLNLLDASDSLDLFQWKILKLRNDSLIILDESAGVLRFKKNL